MDNQQINKTMKTLAQLLRMKEELDAEIDAEKDKLKEHMRETGVNVLLGDEHKASLSDVTSERLDTKALKKEMPELAARYTVTTKSLRFNFT